jgi:5-methyltetrahydrofolate--homocysteine methyltransferase
MKALIIAQRILDGQSAGIETALDRAIVDQSATTVLQESVLPSMQDTVDGFLAGGMILPVLLRSLEVVHRCLRHLAQHYLTPAEVYARGSVVVATLAGDVHDIGRALLVSVLSAAGYTVHDLGKRVPVETIVDAVVRLQPDAVCLSALLVTTSRQMPLCVQTLDARGLHVPVLVGGAAINRGFGRRSAILPDGRVYEPGVFYCKDVFEGLATVDALLDPERRAHLVAQVRSDIEAERTPSPPPPVRRHLSPQQPPDTNVAVPTPPYWGARPRLADVRQVHLSLDRSTLFRFHWGGYRSSEAEYLRLVGDYFEPTLASLTRDALRDGWLQPLIVAGYFACNAVEDSLLLFDPNDPSLEVARLNFPRQPDGERLCLADYFRPVASGQRDVVALQAVSAGPRAGEYIERLQRSGEYERMLLVNGLASATAEALAEYAHNLARRELGLAAQRGLRFSWGYPACPDLGEQRKILPLLHAEAHIGLQLTESNNLDPEHSTAAIVVHHPEAKYFAVRLTET